MDGRVLAAFSGLWDALAAAGFGPEHVKRVFMELPRVSGAGGREGGRQGRREGRREGRTEGRRDR